ncbi:polysaccharide deacetylase family protein [Rhodococcus sp. BP-149]|uniref:polysaccharide deacetylase family protein n=1 Tax=unclassified Rhodococcus (in: high G+C Gram-positive bacteria) TaxID=192944 RepID=UPI001C9AF9A3|nr:MULTISPECIES: polysaccharide deacetylase family protein [unclassified Rhodococcus (in: high G+C Gram-positive bacteria)]MBY6685673.1 polysaccharide deacetylase family protein [Rhodococcus sp. BP-288]MBY6694779.1 polysaccharide deacetylase family protein [Rhodococcus sp. BP-188]MBY6696625.1 polysaccharide deacetylase family protein [Rhodococcus sp. BP-285]MBY6703281.1 polysaccharide deacetylase family protein [Rhodococcus sp. BP-283]MBY6710765.1 polysaccharide deacetylase family protein [Rho
MTESDPTLTLTFDNGPTPGVTEAVLDELRSRGLRATFFVVGQDFVDPARRDLVLRARDEGHWIGNHTTTHGIPLGRRADPAVEVGEIALTDEALSDAAGGRKLFRPNGAGSMGPHLLSPAALQYLIERRYTVVLWDVYVRDPHEPDLWVDRALAELPKRADNVLVTHDVPTGAMVHLPRFLDTVQDLGIRIVQEIPVHATPLREGVVVGDIDAICGTS